MHPAQTRTPLPTRRVFYQDMQLRPDLIWAVCGRILQQAGSRKGFQENSGYATIGIIKSVIEEPHDSRGSGRTWEMSIKVVEARVKWNFTCQDGSGTANMLQCLSFPLQAMMK